LLESEPSVIKTIPVKAGAVIEAFKDKLTKKDTAFFPVSEIQYSDLVEDVMVALDSAHSTDIKPLYKICVEHTVPLKLTPERTDKLVGYVTEAAAKNESGVLIGLLKATAKVMIKEAGISADEGEADVHLAWSACVTEALKPEPEPKDEAAEFIDALLPA
jgi:hypothetical protein